MVYGPPSPVESVSLFRSYAPVLAAHAADRAPQPLPEFQ